MTYNERVQLNLNLHKEILSMLNSTFYFTEAEYLHQQDGENWSAVEELEYANMFGYALFDSVQKIPKSAKKPQVEKRHDLSWFTKIAIKRNAIRPEKPEPHLTPVSRRYQGKEFVKINEQKVFADMLALLENWKKMLESGEDLRALKIKIGWGNIFRIDALEVAQLSLEVIKTQVAVAQSKARQEPV